MIRDKVVEILLSAAFNLLLGNGKHFPHLICSITLISVFFHFFFFNFFLFSYFCVHEAKLGTCMQRGGPSLRAFLKQLRVCLSSSSFLLPPLQAREARKLCSTKII